MSSNAIKIWGMLHLINLYGIYVSKLFLLTYFSIYSKKICQNGPKSAFAYQAWTAFWVITSSFFIRYGQSWALKLSTRQDKSYGEIIPIDAKTFIWKATPAWSQMTWFFDFWKVTYHNLKILKKLKMTAYLKTFFFSNLNAHSTHILKY